MSKQYEVKKYKSFDDMELDENLLRGVYGYGFEAPSIIQQSAIMPIISGRDVIAQSQSGTGKTGAFVIGALQKIDYSMKKCQVLILSPTHELAYQTNVVLNHLGDFLKVKTQLCIGGTSISESSSNINRGVHVVVATPGRVLDLIGRRILKTDYLKLFIMDEADDLLSKGFADQIKELFGVIPPDVQVCLISATMPNEVLDITEKFMNDPVKILVKREQLTLEGIKQFYVAIDSDRYKFDTLCDLYNTLSITQCIIYLNTKKKVENLNDMLRDNGFTVSCIHGDLRESERSKVMNDFRSGGTRVLLATDIIARGIDVQQVSLVINFDLPSNKENYLHRIGRSGRFGRKGVAINFVTYDDTRILREIEQFYNTKIEELPKNIKELLC